MHWSNRNLKVIINQLGFRNGHGIKRVLVSDVPEACSVFGAAIFTVPRTKSATIRPLMIRPVSVT